MVPSEIVKGDCELDQRGLQMILPSFVFVWDQENPRCPLGQGWTKISDVIRTIEAKYKKIWTPTETIGRFGLGKTCSEHLQRSRGQGDSRPLTILVFENNEPKFLDYEPYLINSLKNREFHVPTYWAQKVIQCARWWDMVIVKPITAEMLGIGVAADSRLEPIFLW